MRVAVDERQHAAVLSALLPLFLLGRLRLDDGDLGFPPLSPSPLAGTDGLASLCRNGQFLPFLILTSTLHGILEVSFLSLPLPPFPEPFRLWMGFSGEFSLVFVRL